MPELVGSFEANPFAGRISVASPLGRALLGRRGGEVAAVDAPKGRLQFKILEIQEASDVKLRLGGVLFGRCVMKLLVAYDALEHSAFALDKAAEVAAAEGAEVTILSVVQPDARGTKSGGHVGSAPHADTDVDPAAPASVGGRGCGEGRSRRSGGGDSERGARREL